MLFNLNINNSLLIGEGQSELKEPSLLTYRNLIVSGKIEKENVTIL